ncbi:MAG: CGNR zinc finger domain-containing protein [Gemmatimonadota bacterium]
MVERKMTSIEEIPLVGGRLCLDFVNTTGARASAEPRERLRSYEDLLTWARRADVLPEEAVPRLLVEARARPAKAREALHDAIRVRETLYGVLRPLAEGERPGADALSALDVLLVEGAGRRALEVGPDGIAWRWSREPAEQTWFLWPIVHSAERLLTLEEASDLKRCGECDWLFVDETRNGSRRWCKKLCGDRVRARRYYRRRQES